MKFIFGFLLIIQPRSQRNIVQQCTTDKVANMVADMKIDRVAAMEVEKVADMFKTKYTKSLLSFASLL